MKYAREAQEHGRAIHVSHKIESGEAQGGGAAMFKQYARDAKDHGRSVHVSHKAPAADEGGGAAMFKQYANDAMEHGRAVHVSHKPAMTSREPVSVAHIYAPHTHDRHGRSETIHPTPEARARARV